MIMRDQQLSQVIQRAEQPDDEAFLQELLGQSRPDLVALPFAESLKALVVNQQFQAQHRNYKTRFPGADFDIIEFQEQPVGRLYIDRNFREIRVIDIALLPAWRGRGIGTRLMLRVINEATLLRLPLRLTVRPDIRACQWYLNLGFLVVNKHPANWELERTPDPIPGILGHVSRNYGAVQAV